MLYQLLCISYKDRLSGAHKEFFIWGGGGVLTLLSEYYLCLIFTIILLKLCHRYT